jgi:hypothetical protein
MLIILGINWGKTVQVYIEAKKTILFMFVKLCLLKCKCVLKKANHSVFLGDSPQHYQILRSGTSFFFSRGHARS